MSVRLKWWNSRRLPLLLLGALAAVLAGCTSQATPVEQALSPESRQTAGPSQRGPQTILQQEDLENIERLDALVEQYQKAGPAEEKIAALALHQANEATAKRNFNAAVKGYGEAASLKPNVSALIGYSDAIVMIPLEDALQGFRRALSIYRVALAFNERVEQSPDAKAQLQDRIRCLETFIAQPGSASDPPCQLVADALKERRAYQ